MLSEFGSETENATLKRGIVERIASEGAISFRDFMAMALYDPGLGYYTADREKLGRHGDFLTSPEVSPIFGALVGRQLREMWSALGRPASFGLVEAGAGSGALMRDALNWARDAAPDFFAALAPAIAEISPSLRERQQRVLTAEGHANRVRWLDELPPGVSGCIFANELLDAMPVHRVARRGAKLHEVYVAWDGERFTEELRPATHEIEAYFERLGAGPGEDCYAEVNTEAPAWVARAANALERGFLLLFDYGYEAEELYAAWRRDGTLLCFYGHNPGTDPYARVGRQDITSHVDFTTVRHAGEAAGLRTLGLTTQSEFLERLGVAEALGAAPAGGSLEEHYARRRSVMELLDPASLGRIRVLIQSKGVTDASLTGLRARPD